MKIKNFQDNLRPSSLPQEVALSGNFVCGQMVNRQEVQQSYMKQQGQPQGYGQFGQRDPRYPQYGQVSGAEYDQRHSLITAAHASQPADKKKDNLMSMFNQLTASVQQNQFNR